jgi:hypothetical protein
MYQYAPAVRASRWPGVLCHYGQLPPPDAPPGRPSPRAAPPDGTYIRGAGDEFVEGCGVYHQTKSHARQIQETGDGSSADKDKVNDYLLPPFSAVQKIAIRNGGVSDGKAPCIYIQCEVRKEIPSC